ncbi:hypothetical protein J5226_08370 [Lysobacter sp. K5869]|uniref:hypothetical protein n=1 Tax=Lysobacter sp. K5869 TaxID=2820808 RepID=UPI001C060244|nr:hypothetical protein [Lysobacter sp. K5869]QWP78391.1 hypothetical protein J5226_08370 [Lysobacter sp. K5869]
MRTSLFRIFVSVAFLMGCSTPPQRYTSERLDVQTLIQPPARYGAKGVDQVVASLQKRYGVAAGTSLSSLADANQGQTLDDGTVVVKTLTDINATGDVARDVRIDIAAQPCLPVARAAGWIDATRLSATPGSGTATGHVGYRFVSAEVRIDLTGEFGEQECLRVIEIYKQP